MYGWIETFSGGEFHFVEPSASNVTIGDIAHSLSMLCRFTGHCRKFYSVAEHSVGVSRLVPIEYAMQGLLHDAAEAYLGDVASPLKQLLLDYQELELDVEAVIAERFGLPEELHPSIRQADIEILLAEKQQLLRPGRKWELEKKYKPALFIARGLAPDEAEREFLTRFNQLKKLGL